jgi:magnesium transporter
VSPARAGARTNKGRKRPPGLEVSARLFDAHHDDRRVDIVAGIAKSIPDHCLLWVDATGEDPAAAAELLDQVGLESSAYAPIDADAKPLIELHRDSFHLRVAAITTTRGRDEQTFLDLVAAKNVVLTAHPGPTPFLGEIDERLKRDTTLGEIDSSGFVAVLLDGLVTTYLATADALEAEVDRLDEDALKPSAQRDLLADLVHLRHRIAAVRRHLTDHREVFAAIARADFERVSSEEAAVHLRAVADRFERAIEAVERTREALVGTFDIHTTRTAQRTNDIVKVLTVVSVMLLPTTVIAGIMGMNIKAPYSNDDPTIFWIVLALIVAIAVSTLTVLRLRRWL